MLWDVTGCYSMLLDVMGCYWMLRDVTRCYWMLRGVTGCYGMLLDVNGCYFPRHLVSLPSFLFAVNRLSNMTFREITVSVSDMIHV
jgi:hypothetical protein